MVYLKELQNSIGLDYKEGEKDCPEIRLKR